MSATPLRLVITPYLNTRALVHHGAPAGAELIALPPREAGPAIAGGRAVAGIVPVGALAEFEHEIELLGHYGIACPAAAQSVLFFSRAGFDALGEQSRIRLSTESRSSVRLLHVLLSWQGRGLPQVAGPDEAIDGELVIGDAALVRAAAADSPLRHVTDLAERWRAATGLPMVFARWVIRRDAPGAQRARLLEWLADYRRAEARLLDVTAALDGARAGLDQQRARRYLAGIRTVLGVAELRGQQRYLDELERLDWPDFAPSGPAATRRPSHAVPQAVGLR